MPTTVYLEEDNTRNVEFPNDGGKFLNISYSRYKVCGESAESQSGAADKLRKVGKLQFSLSLVPRPSLRGRKFFSPFAL